MSTALGDARFVIDAEDGYSAVGIADTKLTVVDTEQTVVIDGESTDLLTVTQEPTTEVVLTEVINPAPVVVVDEPTFFIEATTPGPQGVQGPPGPVADIRVMQEPVEDIDGTRVTFTLPNSHTYMAGSLMVLLNGLAEPVIEQRPRQFTFYDAPLPGDVIYLRYQRP